MEAAMLADDKAQSFALKQLIGQSIKFLATFLISGFGMLLCSLIGSLAFPIGGSGAIIGAIVGAIVFCCIGSLTSGLWKELALAWIPDATTVNSILPDAIAREFHGHGNFTLYVTVHNTEHVHVTGRLWHNPDLYVEVGCGDNPIKRTCVKRDGVFNETFRFDVRAHDKVVAFRVHDQRPFGSSSVGFLVVEIEKIIKGEFPPRFEHPLEVAQSDTLVFKGDVVPKILISFKQEAIDFQQPPTYGSLA
eukprot:TRINITY_DN51829_c0_g1_i1.p1 TRINITY_DN51829_c0_g1~~TRINITY_DN51829_c0_g1_i1.p1  ORF type:complete len:248 (-),score=25.30 TRINITY_DN51829_c0_g1_i1:212-955(-)